MITYLKDWRDFLRYEVWPEVRTFWWMVWGASKNSPRKRERKPMADTIDLSSRVWGHNYEVLRCHEGGHKIELAMWTSDGPAIGDFLILHHDDGDTTRYEIEELERCRDPKDMYFATCYFAPRQAASNTSGIDEKSGG